VSGAPLLPPGSSLLVVAAVSVRGAVVVVWSMFGLLLVNGLVTVVLVASRAGFLAVLAAFCSAPFVLFALWFAHERELSGRPPDHRHVRSADADDWETTP
jgi:hypothetical protein